MLTRKENFKNDRKSYSTSKEAKHPQQALVKAPTQQLVKTLSSTTQQPDKTPL